jgi:hypothetical protein
MQYIVYVPDPACVWRRRASIKENLTFLGGIIPEHVQHPQSSCVHFAVGMEGQRNMWTTSLGATAALRLFSAMYRVIKNYNLVCIRNQIGMGRCCDKALFARL